VQRLPAEQLGVAGDDLALTRGRQALIDSRGTVPEEFVLADLQEATDCLEEITGRRTTDDLLRHIFERFCVGK